MLTSMHFGFDPALKPIKQDLARTKKLLAEAGLPQRRRHRPQRPSGPVRARQGGGRGGRPASSTRPGIRTTLKTFEFVNYLNNMVYVHKAGPVWLIGWGTPTMDAETVYVPLFRSGNIFANWHNEDFNRMVDEAQTIMDEKKRREQYHRINKLWVEDMPAVPLYQQVDLYGANKRLNWKARSDELMQGVRHVAQGRPVARAAR